MALAAGLTAGLLLDYAVGLAKVLFGVSTIDPTTFVLVAALLALVVLLACYVPARLASKADPIRWRCAMNEKRPFVAEEVLRFFNCVLTGPREIV
ncbi:MAG TPA: hypothetical protein VFQ41_24370 [Candidatus Angelobacter sp.]|nr:hypothetical protein [Candidatus Angelobacter sp.]